MNIRRFIVLFTIIVFTNCYGLIYISSVGGLELIDLCLLIITLYTFNAVIRKKRLIQDLLKGITREFYLFLIIVIAVAISMLFRDTGTLFTGLKVGRMYFILLLALIIYEDVVKSKSTKFWDSFLMISGGIYAFVILFFFLAPTVTQTIFTEFSYMDTDNAWGTGAARKVVKSNNGLLFLHLAFFLRASKIIYQNRKVKLFDFLYCLLFYNRIRSSFHHYQLNL